MRAARFSFIALLVLVACGSDSPARTSSSASSSQSSVAGTSWKLKSFQGPGGNASVPAAPGANAPLAFTNDGKVTGSTGCNGFGGTYTQSGASLTITLGPTTLMGCANPLVNAQEAALLQHFGNVTGFTIDGDTLTLTDKGGAVLLTYTAALTSLEGTAWNATGVNNGKGAVSTTALTEKLTASFDAGGAFEAFGGCNQLSGKYATSGTTGLTITNLVGTKITCGEEIDALEAQYTAALGAVTQYEIAGDTLTLRDSGGATQATFTRSR